MHEKLGDSDVYAFDIKMVVKSKASVLGVDNQHSQLSPIPLKEGRIWGEILNAPQEGLVSYSL